MKYLGFLCMSVALSASAANIDNSGIRIIEKSPSQFCQSTARYFGTQRYEMKKQGIPLQKALAEGGGTAIVRAITEVIYREDVKSEKQAAEMGTAACLSYFKLKAPAR